MLNMASEYDCNIFIRKIIEYMYQISKSPLPLYGVDKVCWILYIKV